MRNQIVILYRTHYKHDLPNLITRLFYNDCTCIVFGTCWQVPSSMKAEACRGLPRHVETNLSLEKGGML